MRESGHLWTVSCAKTDISCWHSWLHPARAMRAYVSVHLLCGNHGDHVDPLLPDHLPEVGARVGEWTLRGDVMPLLASDHHLGKQTRNQI